MLWDTQSKNKTQMLATMSDKPPRTKVNEAKQDEGEVDSEIEEDVEEEDEDEEYVEPSEDEWDELEDDDDDDEGVKEEEEEGGEEDGEKVEDREDSNDIVQVSHQVKDLLEELNVQVLLEVTGSMSAREDQ